MAISKTSLFVIFSLLLLSFSVFGEHVSFDTPASIKRQVPTGSNLFQSNGRLLRNVPSGPNPRESPGTPPSPPSSIKQSTINNVAQHRLLKYGIKGQMPTGSIPFQSNGRLLRGVPSGPNPRESPGTPPSPPSSINQSTNNNAAQHRLPKYGIKRQMPTGSIPFQSNGRLLCGVPSGPNPRESPGAPPSPPSYINQSTNNNAAQHRLPKHGIKGQMPTGSIPFQSNGRLLRGVPSGPNPRESPGTPPSSPSSINQSTINNDHRLAKYGIKRQMPTGSISVQSNGRLLRGVPSGPNPRESPGAPPSPPSSIYAAQHRLLKYEIKRQMPTGSNPFQSNGRLLRGVPSGPNSRESPGTQPSSPPH